MIAAVIFLSNASAEVLLPAEETLFLLSHLLVLSSMFIPVLKSISFFALFPPEPVGDLLTTAKLVLYKNATASF